MSAACAGRKGAICWRGPPAEITLGDVLRAVDGPVFDTPGLNNSDGPPELRRAWQRLQQAIETTAEAITFQKLLEESAEKEKMYYI